ncbi:MAG: HNH endonuclease signature motif containing protein [Hespellia sp.]|nr:HNH endonuclease signature motif containing protein [Hespellia sp.]
MSERYVLYNGTMFAAFADSGKVIKVFELEKAHTWSTPQKAREVRKRVPGKLSYYHVYQVGVDGNLDKVSKRKRNRKTYSRNERIEIYNRYNGRCNICGRKLDFSEMTLDHIIPLDKDGADAMENLQCSCQMCNSIKMNILPQDFMERIGCIYLYQTGKRLGEDSLRWKLARHLIRC